MARDEATSAESRPENQYDTRALEASYLAAGQGERLAELRLLAAWAEVQPDDLADLVEAGALARVEPDHGEPQWVLLAPRGGTELRVGGVPVRLVSVSSPLGSALCGLAAGDVGEVETPRGPQRWTLLAVE
jgi:transcription elongation GreA/GreB family factor